MKARQQLAREIRQAARIAALRKLAEETATAYREAELLAKARELLDRRAADSIDLPPEHRRLRAMLLGRVLPPPRKGESKI
jgi:hypothetical protein